MNTRRSRSDNVIPLRTCATHVAEKLDAGEDLSLMDKTIFRDTFDRVWRRYLSVNEIVLLGYIISRTVGWGRVSFTASSENILHGTEDFSGCGLDRATYFRTMKSLEQKGAVARQSLKDRTKVTINAKWNPKSDTQEVGMLPIPKRKKALEVPEDQDQKSQYDTPASITQILLRSHSETLNTVVDKTGSIIGSPSASAPGERVEELSEQKDFSPEEGPLSPQPPVPPEQVLQPVAPSVQVRSRVAALQAKSREDLAAKVDEVKAKASGKAKRLSATDAEALWKAVLVEAHPLQMHLAWSIKDKGQVNNLIKKWSFSQQGTVANFLDYAVRHWATIVRRRFGWMTENKAPRYPSLGFLIWRLNDFVEAWMTNQASAFVRDDEQDRYDRLRTSGLSHEEAIFEMARVTAGANLRKETQDRLAKAQQLERRARNREERAEKLEGLADKLSPASGFEIIPGTQRRPGQVWGHQPMVRRVAPDPQPVSEAQKPTPQSLPSNVPSREEVLARMQQMMNMTKGQNE